MEIEDFFKKSLLDKIIALLVLAVVFLLGWIVRNFPFLSALNTLAENTKPLNMLIVITVLFLLLLLALVFLFKQSKIIKSLGAKPDEGTMRPHYGVNWKVYLTTGEVCDVPYCGCCNPPKILTHRKWSTGYIEFLCGNREYHFLRSDADIAKGDSIADVYKAVQEIYKNQNNIHTSFNLINYL